MLGLVVGFIGGVIFTPLYIFQSRIKAFGGIKIGELLWVFYLMVIVGVIGAMFGIIIGLILGGVFNFVPTGLSKLRKVLIGVFVGIVIHFAIASPFLGFSYGIFYIEHKFSYIHNIELYKSAFIPIWLVYFLATIWFALNFHRKSVWMPAFLKDEA